jgi:hypothetical protein
MLSYRPIDSSVVVLRIDVVYYRHLLCVYIKPHCLSFDLLRSLSVRVDVCRDGKSTDCGYANRALWVIFGPRKEEVTIYWKILRNDIDNLYLLSSFG